jgi:uncharacterized protein with FMN-binding domain
MNKLVPAVLGAAALAIQPLSAAAALKATPKKKVVTTTKTIAGPTTQVSRWGNLQVTLIVKKTTTTVGKKKTVARRITAVNVPTYPNHTDRSVYINQQALPLLQQEVLSAQLNPNISMVSGASDTSQAFVQSLQSAILSAKAI